MTKDDIIALPNPNLRRRSQKVGLITPEILKIVADMKSAMLSWDADREHEVGVALAAIQIDCPYRIVVVRNSFDDKKEITFTTFINPEITKLEGTVEEDYEGCLSVRDIYGMVPRHTKARVRARDESGKEFRLTVEGFLARVLQHEIDHTHGVLFIDHIKDSPKAFFRLTSTGALEQLNFNQDIRDNKTLWDE